MLGSQGRGELLKQVSDIGGKKISSVFFPIAPIFIGLLGQPLSGTQSTPSLASPQLRLKQKIEQLVQTLACLLLWGKG